MIIERLSERTFRLAEGSLDELAERLVERGARRYPPVTPHEFARFWFGARRALIVAYRGGTLLVQGKELQRAVEALSRCARIAGARWMFEENERAPGDDGARSETRSDATPGATL